MEAICSSETSVDNGLHGVISQKIVLFITTSVKNSNSTYLKIVYDRPVFFGTVSTDMCFQSRGWIKTILSFLVLLLCQLHVLQNVNKKDSCEWRTKKCLKYEGVDFTHLAQDSDQWLALMNSGSIKCREFLGWLGNCLFLRRAQIYGVNWSVS
jgi:hypothetical protein